MEIEMEFIIILWKEIKSEFNTYKGSIWRNSREFKINYSVVPVSRHILEGIKLKLGPLLSTVPFTAF